MTSRDEWERWADDWRTAASTLSPDRIRSIVTLEDRRLQRARRVETGIVVAGIAGIGAALIHTHDLLDVISAGLTISGLVALLLFRRGSVPDQGASLSDTTSDFIASSARRLRLQVRAINFIWVAIAINLVFFLPWWISGYSAHRAELDAPIMLASWWFPLAAMAGLIVWSLSFRKRLKADVERLRELEAAYREE
jgi:hypothetical protein